MFFIEDHGCNWLSSHNVEVGYPKHLNQNRLQGVALLELALSSSSAKMVVAGRQVTVWKSALQSTSTQILRVITVQEWSLSNSSAQILCVVTVLEWSFSNSLVQILRVVTVLEWFFF